MLLQKKKRSENQLLNRGRTRERATWQTNFHFYPLLVRCSVERKRMRPVTFLFERWKKKTKNNTFVWGTFCELYFSLIIRSACIGIFFLFPPYISMSQPNVLRTPEGVLFYSCRVKLNPKNEFKIKSENFFDLPTSLSEFLLSSASRLVPNEAYCGTYSVASIAANSWRVWLYLRLPFSLIPNDHHPSSLWEYRNNKQNKNESTST